MIARRSRVRVPSPLAGEGTRERGNTVTEKPDNVFYVVLDGFNYEVLYEWDGVAWVNISSTVNPFRNAPQRACFSFLT